MIKISLLAFLCLGSLVTLSSAFFNQHDIKDRTPDEYVEALLGRWSRPQRREPHFSQQAAEWFFRRLMELDIQDPERQIPPLIQYMASSTIRYSGQVYEDEWFKDNTQNQQDIRRLITEFDNLRRDKNPKFCGMRWMEDTFGTLDHLYGVSTRLLKAKEAGRLPFSEQEDMPKMGAELYQYLLGSIKERVRNCLEHLVPHYGAYLEGDWYKHAPEKYFDKYLMQARGISRLLPSRDLTPEEQAKELIKRAKSLDSFNYRDIWLTTQFCERILEDIDSFISTFNLATILMPDGLQSPDIQQAINGDRFKKLNEYNRLCCRFIVKNSPLAIVLADNKRRLIGYPEEIREIDIGPKWIDHRDTEARSLEMRMRKNVERYHSRSYERRSQFRKEDLPKKKPDNWWDNLTRAQKLYLDLIPSERRELPQRQMMETTIPFGEVQ